MGGGEGGRVRCPGRDKIFLSSPNFPDPFQGPPRLLFSGNLGTCGAFSGGKEVRAYNCLLTSITIFNIIDYILPITIKRHTFLCTSSHLDTTADCAVIDRLV
jgi:hypothetical protein